MNLKNKTLLLAIALLILTSTLGLAISLTKGTTIFSEAPENIPDNAVGKLMPGGGFQIYPNLLVQTWPDGSPIENITIVQHPDGFFLIRKGSDQVNHYMQALPLVLDQNNFLTFLPVLAKKCKIPDNHLNDCGGPNAPDPNLCELNYLKTSCMCSSLHCQMVIEFVPLNEVRTPWN